MQQTRYNLIRVAFLAVAVSAMVGGCAAETEPAPGPMIDPLNPQPLPPVTEKPTSGGSTDKGAGDPPPAPQYGETSSSGAPTSPGSSGNSSSSSSSGSTDAGGQ